MRVTFYEAIEGEVDEAATFLESRQAGLGGDFVARVDAAIDSILEGPERHPVEVGTIRRFRVTRFPYDRDSTTNRGSTMNSALDELTERALALEANDRLELTRRLRASLEADGPRYDEATHAELRRRRDELRSGAVEGISHEQLMSDLRREFPCE